MSNALQLSTNNAIETKDILTSQDIDILRNSKFKGFTDAEIAFSARICSHLQLNPMLNQIHFVKRGNAITPQVGIDGFRLVAQRGGGYAGQDDAEFTGTNPKQPEKATVTVYRNVDGVRCAFTASARWVEYCPQGGQDHMWRKMPFTMLAKCAEALALRKAFPAELSAIRSEEEMAQADTAPVSKATNLNSRAPMKDVSEGAIPAESRKVDAPPPPPAALADRKFPFWAGYEGKTYRELGAKKLAAAVEHIQKQKDASPALVAEVAHITAYLNEIGGEM
jgi:phage recombination protein Bet